MNSIEKQVLSNLWKTLYSNKKLELLDNFFEEINNFKNSLKLPPQANEWYKDAIVYSLYVDLFNTDFKGLEAKLDYLQDLGVSCLWLLPILDSPMKDAGFDIKNYDKIRPELLGLAAEADEAEKETVFLNFLKKAQTKNIQVIFDIAINHTSVEHPWFQESRKSVDNPFRDYYIWNKDTNKYEDARLIFKGMCPSNWEKDGDYYFFHRFFEHQPDLNYKNPEVLLAMTRNLLFWLQKGVAGFRADAIPYLWKEENTDCENLPKTHTVVKFFRAILDFVQPNTLLLAEACQKPAEVIKYFGNEDECHAGYHFPLMPQIFKALAQENSNPIKNILSEEVTPKIPESCQWFTFLRCHDELSLELVYVSEEDRKYIHENYCHEPLWNFRLGEGVSARLANLFKFDDKKIGLAFSIMLSLPGTPIIYYGDEFGKANDENYYEEQKKETGYDDTRYLVRGRIDWQNVENELAKKESFSSKIYSQLKSQIQNRKNWKCFSRGKIEWVNLENLQNRNYDDILAYKREFKDEIVLVIQNLSSSKKLVSLPTYNLPKFDILGQAINNKQNSDFEIEGYGYYWINISTHSK